MNHETTVVTQPAGINLIVYPVYCLRDLLVAFVQRPERWRRREQMSMQFACIDAHTLRDAGISDAQRFIGVHHPFG